MKYLFLILTASFLYCASAANANAGALYDLKMELSAHGQKIASPRMLVSEGLAGTITQDIDNKKNSIDIVVTQNPTKKPKNILLKLTIGTVGLDGKTSIFGNFELAVEEGKKSKTMMKKPDGKEIFTFSVVVKKR